MMVRKWKSKEISKRETGPKSPYARVEQVQEKKQTFWTSEPQIVFLVYHKKKIFEQQMGPGIPGV